MTLYRNSKKLLESLFNNIGQNNECEIWFVDHSASYWARHVPPKNDKKEQLLFRFYYRTMDFLYKWNKMFLTRMALVQGSALWTFTFIFFNVGVRRVFVWYAFVLFHALLVFALVGCIETFLIRRKRSGAFVLRMIKTQQSKIIQIFSYCTMGFLHRNVIMLILL